MSMEAIIMKHNTRRHTIAMKNEVILYHHIFYGINYMSTYDNTSSH